MFQMTALFHQSQNETKSYGGNLSTSEVHDAITLHPVKDTKRMHKLFVYLLGLSAQELFEISTQLQYEIQKTTKLIYRSSRSNMEQLDESLSINPSFLLQSSSMIAPFDWENNATLSSTPEKLSSFTFYINNIRF